MTLYTENSSINMCIHSNRTHICMKYKTGIQLPRRAYPFKHCRQHLCHLLLKLWLTGKQWIIGNHLANHMFMHDNWQVWQQIIHSPYNTTCNGSMEALITKMTLYACLLLTALILVNYYRLFMPSELWHSSLDDRKDILAVKEHT